MKITRRQLRKLINESMLQPTFFLNAKAREELLPKIVADPNVHPKIKDLLKTREPAQTDQGVELLKTLNPEYIEELESYNSHQDSIAYHREFEEQRDNLFFMQVQGIVDKYKHDVGIPLQSDDLTVENISKDTTAGSYTDRSTGRSVKRFTHKRLPGAAIYATDEATLERIARELDSEKGMDGEQLYNGIGGQGQPLLPYINDYYLTAFDSNLKRKNEMHKKGKYELKVFPATPDHRVYKQPTHRKLKLGMYETNLTRNQLKRLILKEFRDLGTNDFENININVPPVPPADDEGGGPGKDWSAELIKRLHKKGYIPMGRSSAAAKVSGDGESMVYVEDIKQNSGVIIHLHARDYRSDANQTDEERMLKGPMMIASTKFEVCDNGMDVNKIIRKLLRLTDKTKNMTGDMIYADLEKLRPEVPNDENEEFDFHSILNDDEYLIDYYMR